MSQMPAFRQPLGAALTLRQKMAIMYVLMLTMFLTALDQSIVATAVPHVVADLGGFNLLPWVFTVYVLTSTVVIPPIGKLTDMFGRKKFIIPGVIIFVLSSAACGFAPSMPLLIAGRGVQGIGSGIIVACVFATLGDLFTPVERAKYFPLFIGMFTFAGLIGPVFGGFLTDGPGWRWCFYINLPVGVLATAFLGMQLPAGGGSGGRLSNIDFLGSTLLCIATSALLLAIAWGQHQFGWAGAQTLALLATTGLFTVLFLLQERRHPNAIIPLSLFRNLPFVQSILITLCAASMIFSAGQFLPTYVQISLGASARMSGVIITPQGLGVFVSGLITGQLIARTGHYKYQMIMGSFGLIVFTFFLRQIDTATVKWHLTAMLALMGLCAGLVMPVTQVITQGAVSQAEQGVAASTRQFFLQIAQVMGLAILGLVFTSSYTSGFERQSAPFAASLPPAAYAQFHDEPSISLDERRFAPIEASVRQSADGDALLQKAIAAQKTGVANGIQGVLTGSMIASIAIFIICLTLREIALRRSFDSPIEAPAEPAPLLEMA